jgi:hypothetical protein
MTQKYSVSPVRVPAEDLVHDIPRATRKHHSAEDKFATLSWLEWLNHRRLIEPNGTIPPAESEEC